MKLCASGNSPIQRRDSIGGEFNLFLALDVFHGARAELLRERRLDSFTKALADEHWWEFKGFSGRELASDDQMGMRVIRVPMDNSCPLDRSAGVLLDASDHVACRALKIDSRIFRGNDDFENALVLFFLPLAGERIQRVLLG
jgi:hypothetical protein